jgi:hypothetical protein
MKREEKRKEIVAKNGIVIRVFLRHLGIQGIRKEH